jgi:hypothetical protein
MHGTMEYKFWLLRRDELLSEATKIRLAQQTRSGRTVRSPLRLFRPFATSKFFIPRDLRRQTP